MKRENKLFDIFPYSGLLRARTTQTGRATLGAEGEEEQHKSILKRIFVTLVTFSSTNKRKHQNRKYINLTGLCT